MSLIRVFCTPWREERARGLHQSGAGLLAPPGVAVGPRIHRL
jgi:hypothetical protein